VWDEREQLIERAKSQGLPYAVVYRLVAHHRANKNLAHSTRISNDALEKSQLIAESIPEHLKA